MSNGGIKFPHTQRIVATITKEFSPYVDSFAANIHQLNHLFKLMHSPPPPLKILSLKRRVPFLVTYAKSLMLVCFSQVG